MGASVKVWWPGVSPFWWFVVEGMITVASQMWLHGEIFKKL